MIWMSGHYLFRRAEIYYVCFLDSPGEFSLFAVMVKHKKLVGIHMIPPEWRNKHDSVFHLKLRTDGLRAQSLGVPDSYSSRIRLAIR